MKKLILLTLIIASALTAKSQQYYNVESGLVSDYRHNTLDTIYNHVDIYEDNGTFTIHFDGELFDKLIVTKIVGNMYLCRSVEYDEENCMISKHPEEKSLIYYFDYMKSKKDHLVAMKFKLR